MGRKRNIKIHTPEEMEKIDRYLRRYYPVMTAQHIADKLGEKASYISNRVSRLGLKKSKEIRTEDYTSVYRKKPKYNPNPITYDTKVILCSAIIRGETVGQIAKDIDRPEKQMEKLLEECKADGTFDRIKEYQEDDLMDSYPTNHSAYRKCQYMR